MYILRIGSAGKGKEIYIFALAPFAVADRAHLALLPGRLLDGSFRAYCVVGADLCSDALAPGLIEMHVWHWPIGTFAGPVRGLARDEVIEGGRCCDIVIVGGREHQACEGSRGKGQEDDDSGRGLHVC
jgi:hypothetical protein